MASNLNEQVMRNGVIFTRLTASSLRTIKAVWNPYNDFATWLSKASPYDNRTSKEYNTCHGHLISKYFVANSP